MAQAGWYQTPTKHWFEGGEGGGGQSSGGDSVYLDANGNAFDNLNGNRLNGIDVNSLTPFLQNYGNISGTDTSGMNADQIRKTANDWVSSYGGIDGIPAHNGGIGGWLSANLPGLLASGVVGGALAGGGLGGPVMGASDLAGGAGLGTAGWTSGYDLAGGGSLGGNGLGAVADNFGKDLVGSDWASGVAGTGNGGLLPQTAGGLTAGNTAANGIGSGINSTNLGGILDKLKNVPGGPSSLSKLLSGNATQDDYLKLAGTLGSTVLGYLGAENQAGALSDTADKYLALGQPYRGALAASYAPGFSMNNEPGYKDAIDQTMQSYLRKASTGGNPFDNPGVSTEALKYVTAGTALPQLNTYRSQLGSFGQLGVNTAGTADMGAAGASGGTYDALGYGLSQLTAPKNNTLQDLVQKYILNSGNSLA